VARGGFETEESGGSHCLMAWSNGMDERRGGGVWDGGRRTSVVLGESIDLASGWMDRSGGYERAWSFINFTESMNRSFRT
jgi:hypothetical protein